MERIIVKYSCAEDDLAFLTDLRFAFFLEASRVGFLVKYPERPIEYTLAPDDPEFDTSILGTSLREVAHRQSRRAIKDYHNGIETVKSGDRHLEVPGHLTNYGERFFQIGSEGKNCTFKFRGHRVLLSLEVNAFQQMRLAHLAAVVRDRRASVGFRLTADELEVNLEKLRQDA